MRRNPIYVFDNRSSFGIDQVPLGSIVQILDADGLGNPAIVQLISISNIGSTTTIGDFLDGSDSTSLDQNTLSELEKVGGGWRLLGKNSANYATPGINAVDLSTSETPGTYGAKGITSFAVGTGTKASNENSVAMGIYNLGVNPDTVLEIGGGTFTDPKNIVEVYDTGIMVEPISTITEIDNRGPKALTTVEYVQARVAGEFPNQTTDALVEGSANLYYTDTRDTANFNTNIALVGLGTLADVDLTTAPLIGQTLKWSGMEWVPENDLHEVTKVNGEIGDVVLNTDKVLEGTNKYYSEILFNNSLSLKTTDDVVQGTTNLYYNQTTTTDDARGIVAATPLGNLADVDGTFGAFSGQILTWNGVEWAPAFLTKSEIDTLGVNAASVDGNTVETAVPVNALFTDTVYDDTTIDTAVAANTTHAALVAGNPHGVTALDLTLDNVDNTSDIDKPVSTATQTALSLKQNIGTYSATIDLSTATSITVVNGLITASA